MKFCPNCGRKRENEEKICPCGYDYEKGEVDETKSSPLDCFAREDATLNPNLTTKSLEELKSIKLDYGDLLAVSFTSSGGMMGSFYHDELSFEKNELTVQDQSWHHGERKQTIYKVDEKKAQELKKILVDNNFGAWNTLPINSAFIAYDAPTSSMNLRYEKSSISIPSLIYTDKEESALYMSVREMIKSFMQQENIIKEEVITPGEELNVMGMGMTGFHKFCPMCASILTTNKCSKCGYEEKHYEA